MSGGSLDYMYEKVQSVADEIAGRATTSLQKEFSKHLSKISEALHDLEWVYSRDYADGDEERSIRKVLSHFQPLADTHFKILCGLTLELTKLRQAECKHLCVANFAAECLQKLIESVQREMAQKNTTSD